jgi:hypothetical protein
MLDSCPHILVTGADGAASKARMNTVVSASGSDPLTLQVSTADGGQDLGQLVRGSDRQITIHTADGSPLTGIEPGPYADPGAAMAAISAHLNGMCLYSPANRQGHSFAATIGFLAGLPTRGP